MAKKTIKQKIYQLTTWFYKYGNKRKQMDTLSSDGEIYWTAFEPKVGSRHIVYVTDKEGNEILPAYVVKGTDRPSFKVNFTGELVFNNLTLSLYDPVVPSTPQRIMSAIHDNKQWNIDIKILGPVGDVVEYWEIKDAKVKDVQFSSMDWSGDGDPAIVNVTFEIKLATLKY